MRPADLKRGPWSRLIGLCLALAAGSALAAQTCKYDSIPATAPASRFTDNGDGTVTDKATGLQWKRCSEGQTWSSGTCTGSATTHTWQQALQLAGGVSYAGQSDWRLPNVKELASIVELACSEPAIDLAAFPGPLGGFKVWTSSPAASQVNVAHGVNFSGGFPLLTYITTHYEVKLVRGGQIGGPLNDTGLDWWAELDNNHLAKEPPGYPDQDASYGLDATQDNDADGHAGFAFTKLDASGNPLPASATSWSCVRDNVTGLIWEIKTDDGGLRDMDWTYAWHNPDPATNGGSEGTLGGGYCNGHNGCDTQTYVASVNAAGLCGASDWRLPTVPELHSLLDYGTPSIDTGWFPQTASYLYWSSSPDARNVDKAWFFSFFPNSGAQGSSAKAVGSSVRLVRGGQAWPLDDHGNARDTATKIGVDSRTAGRINFAGDNDFFRVQVGTAGTLTLYTTGSTDTYGYLLNAQGGELARNDDASPTNKNFRIKRSVAPGTYFVRARHALSSGTGAYTLAAEFTAANGKAQRAVLLLHGMNSVPGTWNRLVDERWSGTCEDIHAGVVTPKPAPAQDSLGAVCYRLKFGRYDRTGFTGLENRRCPTTEKEGCKGDFTAIYSADQEDLGVEVFSAVRAILWRLGSDTQVVVLGHSRGGLAARTFLQRSATSAERKAVVGLVTTGTPHKGSPLGRIYAYLKTYCLDSDGKRINSGNRAGKPTAVWSACEDDWEAVDDLELSVPDANLYVGKPTVAFLAPGSSQIQTLNAPGSLANLPSGLSVVQLRYVGQYLGHLGVTAEVLGYSVWPRSGGQYWDQFSMRSRDYALCGGVTIPGSCAFTEDTLAFNGDGIVPRDWQGIPGLADVPGLAAQVLITVPGGIFHKDETGRVLNIATALGRVEAWK